jgi:hypothetical protein
VGTQIAPGSCKASITATVIRLTLDSDLPIHMVSGTLARLTAYPILGVTILAPWPGPSISQFLHFY